MPRHDPPPDISPTASAAAGDSDDDLVRGIAAGNQAAWGVLLARYLDRITGYAWHMLRDHAEAEDVAQETFMRLMNKAATWQPGGAKLSTWLYRVAINQCIDRRRAKRPESIETVPDFAAEGGDENDLGRRLDMTNTVRKALATLPDRQMEAITLVHYQGMSNIEAASLLEVSVDALESLLARARRALRNELSPVAADLLGEWS